VPLLRKNYYCTQECSRQQRSTWAQHLGKNGTPNDWLHKFVDKLGPDPDDLKLEDLTENELSEFACVMRTVMFRDLFRFTFMSRNMDREKALIDDLVGQIEMVVPDYSKTLNGARSPPRRSTKRMG
jgi:hypothetical protein